MSAERPNCGAQLKKLWPKVFLILAFGGLLALAIIYMPKLIDFKTISKIPQKIFTKEEPQKPLEKPVSKLDELQAEYLSRLKNNLEKIKEAYKEDLLLDREPYQNHDKYLQNKERSKELKQTEKQCEKEMEDLKIDEQKYYKGKLPNELSEQWKSIEAEHALLMYDQVTEKLRILDEMKKNVKKLINESNPSKQRAIIGRSETPKTLASESHSVIPEYPSKRTRIVVTFIGKYDSGTGAGGFEADYQGKKISVQFGWKDLKVSSGNIEVNSNLDSYFRERFIKGKRIDLTGQWITEDCNVFEADGINLSPDSPIS